MLDSMPICIVISFPIILALFGIYLRYKSRNKEEYIAGWYFISIGFGILCLFLVLLLLYKFNII